MAQSQSNNNKWVRHMDVWHKYQVRREYTCVSDKTRDTGNQSAQSHYTVVAVTGNEKTAD